jgi:DNA excision repair protein ERCC-4
VVELAQGLAPAMKAIQKAVLVCMDDCLKELKRVTTLSLEGGEQLTLANGIFRSFHATLRRQLDPEWHRLSPKTKQLVEDLRCVGFVCVYWGW